MELFYYLFKNFDIEDIFGASLEERRLDKIMKEKKMKQNQ
jgi:hypothetical protein